MRIKTMMSVAVLAVSSAALAQVTTKPKTPPANTMAMPMNSTDMPMNDTMNTQDETMMNDSSMPDTMAPNSTMPPK